MIFFVFKTTEIKPQKRKKAIFNEFHFQKFLSKCDFLMLYLRVFYYGTYCIILAGFKHVTLKWLKTFQG